MGKLNEHAICYSCGILYTRSVIPGRKPKCHRCKNSLNFTKDVHRGD